MNGTSSRERRASPRHQWKQRCSAAGVHFFDRTTGLNVVLDEIPIPASLHSRAPRQVSIALTNRCDLTCAHCYAPKSRAELRFGVVTQWLAELDSHGALCVGFGGGEPTLYPEKPPIDGNASIPDTWLSRTTESHERWIRAGTTSVPRSLLRRETIGNHRGPWVAVHGFVKAEDRIIGPEAWAFISALVVSKESKTRLVAALTSGTRPWETRDVPSDHYISSST